MYIILSPLWQRRVDFRVSNADSGQGTVKGHVAYNHFAPNIVADACQMLVKKCQMCSNKLVAPPAVIL